MKENFAFFFFFLFWLFCTSSGEIKVEKVVDPSLLGEGPHWDSEKQCLYYVDIFGQTVNKYDPQTQELNKVHIEGGPVTLVVPDTFDDNKFLVGRKLDIVSIKWDGKSSKPASLTVLASVDKDKPENRFNDGKVDSSGRLWAGTMGPEKPDIVPEQGSLYSFDWPDRFVPQKRLAPVSISNGLAWSDKDDLMYFIDSPLREIHVFDFDVVSGDISKRRVLFKFDSHNITGVPDGMTIDENGNLWVAVFGGSSVLHIDGKEGKLLNKIHFPATQITSCAFGGKDLEDMYVTSAKINLSDDELAKQPLAGALFKVTGLGVRGQVKKNKARML